MDDSLSLDIFASQAKKIYFAGEILLLENRLPTFSVIYEKENETQARKFDVKG